MTPAAESRLPHPGLSEEITGYFRAVTEYYCNGPSVWRAPVLIGKDRPELDRPVLPYRTRDIPPDLDTIELSTPILTRSEEVDAEISTKRELLRKGEVPGFPSPQGVGLLKELCRETTDALYDLVGRPVHLPKKRAKEHGGAVRDYLYVLEFQGPVQYVMYGHTTVLRPRLADYVLAAVRHGYALLNGWVSPAVGDAKELEDIALTWGAELHGQPDSNEMFFGLPWKTAQAIARAAFEENTDWAERPADWRDRGRWSTAVFNCRTLPEHQASLAAEYQAWRTANDVTGDIPIWLL